MSRDRGWKPLRGGAARTLWCWLNGHRWFECPDATTRCSRCATVQPQPEPPWPVVWECHWPAPSLVREGHSCPQCDGSHEHEWVAWHDVPRVGGEITVVGGVSGGGVPVRCRVCGGRKCDISNCRARRHHGGPHEPYVAETASAP